MQNHLRYCLTIRSALVKSSSKFKRMSESNPSPSLAELYPARSSLNFKKFIHILLEKAWLVATCLVIAVVAAIFYLQKSPPLFASTATILVEQSDKNVVNVQKVQQEDYRGLESLRTIEQILKSRTLLERVASANKLSRDPRFLPQTGIEYTDAEVANILSKMITVSLRRFTRLIDITVVHTNPDVAALVANSLVKEHARQHLENYSSTSDIASEFLVEEAQRLKKDLSDSENALHSYREKTKTVSLEQRQDIVNPKLIELSQRLTAAKSDRIKTLILISQVRELGTNVQALMTLPVVANDASVVAVKEKITQAEAEFANLTQRYGEKHPKYIQAASQLREWKSNFTNAVLKIPQTVEAAYETAKAAETALESALKEQEEVALALNKQSIGYNVLAREVESNRSLYDTLMLRLKETSLTKELPSNLVRTIQAALAPKLPFAPNKRKILMIGIFLGIFGGIGLALALSALDSSFKTVDEAEAELQLPILSAVPRIKEVKENHTLIVAEDAHSTGAEAFRSLRTTLAMLGRAESRRTFLFTSAVPQEGKTFCSTNYSLSLAQQGLRTLLIDGDLRRPAVENALTGKRTQTAGVTDYLIGKKMLAEIVRPTLHENFFFISAGTTSPNPAELLAQGHFDDLIEEAMLQYDRVVIDSAPIHAVSDTLLLLKRVQTVCLVVRADKTPRKASLRSVHILQKANAQLAGVILNQLPRRGFGSYDPYYDYSYQGKYAEKGVYGSV